MKQITIRGIPPAVEKAVAREAKRGKTSLNRAIVALLEKGAGVAPAAPRSLRYTDLDHLAGCWAREEAAQFNQAVAEQREIEEGMWKTGG